MTRYMLSVHGGSERPAGASLTEAQAQQSFRDIATVNEQLRAAGAWVFGARLEDPDTATVVRVKNGKVLTTDGPYAETKEHLGGFYVIEAADLDAALGWASKTSSAIGMPIEVRPMMSYGDQTGWFGNSPPA